MMAALKRTDDSRFGAIRGELKLNEPMHTHTSWRVGGIADIYFVPADIDDLGQFMNELDAETPVTMTGLGSNLLVRDGGVRGAVVCTHKGLDQVEQPEARVVYAQAGVPGAKVARYSLKAGLRGAVFFAGIPGTIGGALAMNAGAFGGETWDVVTDVETVDRDGTRHRRSADEYKVSYRHVESPRNEWFVAAWMTLAEGDADEGRLAIKEYLSKRGKTQPIGSANAGSVFRNPENDFAARLIEQCGFKGTTYGGAQVSNQHANFIVNTGDATAADIEHLITRIQHEVAEKTGVHLEPEVRVVGEEG